MIFYHPYTYNVHNTYLFTCALDSTKMFFPDAIRLMVTFLLIFFIFSYFLISQNPNLSRLLLILQLQSFFLQPPRLFEQLLSTSSAHVFNFVFFHIFMFAYLCFCSQGCLDCICQHLMHNLKCCISKTYNAFYITIC